MNSAAVCPKSRCSSERSSRMKISSGGVAVVRNEPPPSTSCTWPTGPPLSGRRSGFRPSTDGSAGPLFAMTGPGPRNPRLLYAAPMPPIQDLFSLKDRVAIVTGGSRGLGEEMAEGLAEAGAALVLCARRDEWLTPTVERFRAAGTRVEGMVADVAKSADVQAVVDKAMSAFGRVDILVNNAGVTWGERPESMPLDKWQKVLDINLTGAFLFAQAAGREMLKRRYGRIINVASIAGLHASVNGPHYAGYAA